ncbi:MAG: 1-deoxy-D-xylulose-5-phosphate reductoisomerase [Candidatus Desulfofervidus auxilii]|nr:1-deoxy-D-xylulose-5-phosphate reductoisomerase [Candidatus Desulfofervidus auxilii]
MKNLVILGSTGSIGRQTLEVVSIFPKKFKIVGLAAGKNISLLKEQIERFQPEVVCVINKEYAQALKEALLTKTKILWGEEGYQEIASYPNADLVVSAMVGINGLKPTLAALKAKKTVALANKEALVTGGNIIKKSIKYENQLLPIDSEHSAIFQLLLERDKKTLKRIILTASGGPFWQKDFSLLKDVTPEQAINHPRWTMGAKISVDSATLMNKGLEVIEAMWLFDLDLEKIGIVIHPQSIIHSLVEFHDGVIFAQLSQPDMRIPIAYALNFPERFPLPFTPLDLTNLTLSFFPFDLEKFRCLKLALIAAKIGKSMPIVLNAANEIAVEAFLKKKIKFLEIPELIETVMNAHIPTTVKEIEEIFIVDQWARKKAKEWINRKSS